MHCRSILQLEGIVWRVTCTLNIYPGPLTELLWDKSTYKDIWLLVIFMKKLLLTSAETLSFPFGEVNKPWCHDASIYLNRFVDFSRVCDAVHPRTIMLYIGYFRTLPLIEIRQRWHAHNFVRFMLTEILCRCQQMPLPFSCILAFQSNLVLISLLIEISKSSRTKHYLNCRIIPFHYIAVS